MNDTAAVAANSSFILFNQNDFMIFACANENDCNDWIEVIQYYCSGLDQQIVQSCKQFIETESADQLAQLHQQMQQAHIHLLANDCLMHWTTEKLLVTQFQLFVLSKLPAESI